MADHTSAGEAVSARNGRGRRRQRWDVTSSPEELRMTRMGHRLTVAIAYAGEGFTCNPLIEEGAPIGWCWWCNCGSRAFNLRKWQAIEEALMHLGAPPGPNSFAGLYNGQGADS